MKLLVAVDGSDHSTRAVAQAGRLAAAAGAEVIVLHQRSDHAIDHGPAAPPEEAISQAQQIVDDAIATALTAGAPSARGMVQRGMQGEVAQAVLDVAHTEDVDIIVVGPRGLGRFQGLLVGSVTERLVHHADRPVLVVR